MKKILLFLWCTLIVSMIQGQTVSDVNYVTDKASVTKIVKECQRHQVCNNCPYWLRTDRYGFCDIARQFGTHPYEWEEGGMYTKCYAPKHFHLANFTDVPLNGVKGDDLYVTLER